MKIFKRKYLAVIVNKTQDSFEVQSIIKINSNQEIITYKGNPIPIDTSKYTYANGLKSYFLLDNSSSKQLFFNTNGKTDKLHKKVVDKILNGHIIIDLTTDLNPSLLKTNILIVIFSALFGGLIGYLIGGAI